MEWTGFLFREFELDSAKTFWSFTVWESVWWKSDICKIIGLCATLFWPSLIFSYMSQTFPSLFNVRQIFNAANSRQGVTRPIWEKLFLHHKNIHKMLLRIVSGRHISNFKRLRPIPLRIITIFWVTLRHAALNAWLKILNISKIIPKHQTRIKSFSRW